MSDNFIVEINIEGVTEETTIEDITSFEMRHRNCEGGKVTASWEKGGLSLFCNRCQIGRTLVLYEEVRRDLIELMFRRKKFKDNLTPTQPSRTLATLIPVRRKD